MKKINIKLGFTLIELMVVITIIGVLAGIVYANFADARASARDEARKVALKELQLAIELYKAQNGSYPSVGCSVGNNNFTPTTNCNNYIVGLVPDFIPALPKDPLGNSYQYRSDGTDYKLMTEDVEKNLVDNYTHEFARCPSNNGGVCSSSPPASTYAVYSSGASTW